MADFIIKLRRKNNFTTLPNEVIRDDRLSFKALGLLAYLLSLPPNWKLNLEHISNLRSGNKSASVKTAVAELQQFGYVIIKRVREAGRFVGTEWLVTDSPSFMASPESEPQVDFPPVDNPHIGFPQVENPPLLIKCKKKTDSLIKKQQPQTGDASCRADLIFPSLGVIEIENLQRLMSDLDEESAQNILDELEGYRLAGKINTGSIPLAHKLIRALNNGTFQSSKGVAVKSARSAEAVRIADNNEYREKSRPPAGAHANDCPPVKRIEELRRQKKQQQTGHAG